MFSTGYGPVLSIKNAPFTGWTGKFPRSATLDCKKGKARLLLLYQLSISTESHQNPVDLKNPNYPNPLKKTTNENKKAVR